MTKEEMAKRIDAFAIETGMKMLSWDVSKDFIWSLIADGGEEAQCDFCGSTFVKSRKDMRFCQGECKAAYHSSAREET